MHFTKNILAILIPFVGIGFFVTILFFQGIDADDSLVIEEDYVKKAVIIDQLHRDIPNQHFQNTAVSYLENAGYQVDYITTKDITVDFYKNLPSQGYEYLVIRSHGVTGKTPDDSSKLFTAEKYTTKKYIGEQLLAQLDKGNFYQTSEATIFVEIDDPQALLNGGSIEVTYPFQSSNAEVYDTTTNYFLVGSKTVDNLMVGTFPDSTILMGGCNTMENTLLAESFVKRGASEVIGWSGSVRSHDNDRAMLQVLRESLEEDVSSEQAVESFMKEYRQQPGKSLELKYYSENNKLAISP